MNSANILPIPSFYNPAHAGEWDYSPNTQALFKQAGAWSKTHGVKPVGSDKKNVLLLLIDLQKDFCYPKGSLFVGGRSGRGAIDDNDRIAQFIYRNLRPITDIRTTMDTHSAFQIFFPSFWLDAKENQPDPMTMVTSKMIERGELRPNPIVTPWVCNRNYTWLCEYMLFYCRELERKGKYTLTLWPFHCILGSDGHALAGVIQEARMFHSFVRGSQSHCEVKGVNPLTENYSVIGPEVDKRHDGHPLAQKNVGFVKTLIESDVVIIAGQAASHCVASSIDDLLSEINTKDPALAKKVYILEDCMSSVVVPNVVDFTPQAEAALQKFASAGMHVVRSTDPIESWPGISL